MMHISRRNRCRKFRYSTREDAEACLARIRSKFGWEREKRAYRCDTCLRWHLTKMHNGESWRRMTTEPVKDQHATP